MTRTTRKRTTEDADDAEADDAAKADDAAEEQQRTTQRAQQTTQKETTLYVGRHVQHDRISWEDAAWLGRRGARLNDRATAVRERCQVSDAVAAQNRHHGTAASTRRHGCPPFPPAGA